MKFCNQVLHFLKKFVRLNCAGFIFCGEKCKLTEQRLKTILQDSRGCTRIDVYFREHALSPETTSGGSRGPLKNRCAYSIFSSKRICVDALYSWGDSHMKGTGMLVEIFELKPLRRPIWAWLRLYLTLKED